MKKFLPIMLLALCVSAFSAVPQALLSQAMVPRIVADFPPILEELLDAGISLDNELAENPDMANIIAAVDQSLSSLSKNAKALSIIKRHGWDAGFFPVYRCLLFSLLAITGEEIIAEQQKLVKEAIARVDASKNLSPSEKAEQRDEIMKAYDDTLASIAAAKTLVNPQDLALVRKNIDKLKAAMGFE